MSVRDEYALYVRGADRPLTGDIFAGVSAALRAARCENEVRHAHGQPLVEVRRLIRAEDEINDYAG